MSCLQALYDQKGLDEEFILEVFLVDDGSNDGTSEAIQNQYPWINIIQGTGNLYWNRGMHLAWKTAANTNDFDYYLWLNDDTFLFNNALVEFILSSNTHQNKATFCGSTFSPEHQKISYGGNSLDGRLLVPNGQLQEVYSFNGNVVFIPRDVFKKVGILDPRFPHAIGDFDYGLRIRKSQLKSFTLGKYVGTCEGSDKLPIWCSSNHSFFKRFISLYSPLGNSHPYYYFIFELKHYGILTSIKHFLSIHLRLFFPKLWITK